MTREIGERMTRLHTSLFVLLLVAVSVFGFDGSGHASYASSPSDDCPTLNSMETAAVFRASDTYMSGRYPTVYGTSEVRRVEGDWALVVVIPKVPADRAAIILHRTPQQGWTVVAGPGTAFPPESRPAGTPPSLLEPDPRCG